MCVLNVTCSFNVVDSIEHATHTTLLLTMFSMKLLKGEKIEVFPLQVCLEIQQGLRSTSWFREFLSGAIKQKIHGGSNVTLG